MSKRLTRFFDRLRLGTVSLMLIATSASATPPTITLQPVNTSSCAGSSAVYLLVNASSATSYQWQVDNGSGSGFQNISDGAVYSNTNTATLKINAPAASMHNYKYQCVVTGTSNPTATSTAATLTVKTPITITSQPTSQIICTNGTGSYSVAATGSNLTYKWYAVNGNTLTAIETINSNNTFSGYLTNKLTVTNPQNNRNNMVIICQVSGGCGSPVSTNKVSLRLYTAPQFTSQPANVSTCTGNTAVFVAKAEGSNVTYQWQENSGTGNTWTPLSDDNTYTGASTSRLDIKNLTTMFHGYRYRCVINSPCSSNVRSNEALLTVNQFVNPSVSINSNFNNVCEGMPLTFTATPINGGSSPAYQWKVNGVNEGTSSSVFISTTLKDKDVVTCNLYSNAPCPSAAVVYSNNLPMIITAYQDPAITITSPNTNNTVCSDVPVTFTSATNNAGTTPGYQWQVNGIDVANTANYTTDSLNDGDVVRCVVSTNFMCPASLNGISNNIAMSILPTTIATVSISQKSDTTICRGSEVRLFSYYTNSGVNPTFQWYRNNQPITGATGAVYTTKQISNNDAIKVRFTSNAQCVVPVESIPLRFTVSAPATPTVRVTSVQTGGNNQMFVATPQYGGDNPTYTWYVNNVRQRVQGATFTTSNLKSTDRVYVVMISNHPCVSTTQVTSNMTTTGLDNAYLTFDELKLYPNPNNGQFIVAGEYTANGTQTAKIAVINTVGQVIYNEEIATHSGKLYHEINLQGKCAAGVYMMRIDINGQQEVRRFNISQ